MGVYLPLILLVSIGSLFRCEADTSQDSSPFKLSDLPVLKRSEIPGLYTKKRLGYVGRRHKDLGKDMKRSVYWELKPDFSANEIDLYDDPAKVRSDFNYKSFLEGLGSDDDDEIEEDKNNIQTIVKKSVITNTSEISNNNDNTDGDGKKEINIMLENQPALATTKTEHASKNSTGKKAGKSKVVKKNVGKTAKVASKNKTLKYSNHKKSVKSVSKKERKQTHANQHAKTKSHVANRKKTTKSSKKSTKPHQKAEKRDQTNVTMATNVTKVTTETLKNSSNLTNKSAEENAIAIAKSDVKAINATMTQTAQNSIDAANATLGSNATSNNTIKDKVEEQPLKDTNNTASLTNTTNHTENSTLSVTETKNNTNIDEGVQNGNHTVASPATKSGKKKSSVSSHQKKKHEKTKNKKTKTKTKKHHSRSRRSIEPDDDVDLDEDPCNVNENENDPDEPREKRDLSESTSNKELGTQEQNEFENSHLHGGSRFKRSHRQPKLNANKKYFDNLLTQSTNVAVSRITRLNQNGTSALAKESVKQKRDNSHQVEPENSHQVSKRGLEQIFSPSVQNLINKFKLHQILSQAAPSFSAANLPSATNVNEPQKEVAKATIPSSSSIIANLIPVAQSIIGPNLFTSAFSGGAGGKSPIENALDIVKRQNNYLPQQMKKSAIMTQQNVYGNQKKNNVSSLLQDVHNLQTNAPSTQQQKSELPQQPNPDLHLMVNEIHKRNLMQLMGKIPLKNLTHIFTRSKMNNETNLQVQDGSSTHKHLEVPRINLPPISLPRIHLPPIQPSINRLGTATSEGARRLKNEMKQKAIDNKNLFRGKKGDVPALNNTDDASPSTKKSDAASSHINGGAQEILRSFIHNNNHPSLALFLKRLEKGEEKENADASKKSKVNGEEGEHHGSNTANVIEKILNHKKVLMDNVEMERRSVHSKMKLRPSATNALHNNKGGGHNAQDWKRHKENNINGGERKTKYEIYNALSKKSQKLDLFLKSMDGKISHNASGEKKENVEQPMHHHHSSDQLSKFSSIENHHNNFHHHGSDDVITQQTGTHNNDEHMSRDSIHHQDNEGIKLKSEDRVTSSDNGDSHEKQDGVARRSSLPHSRILAIAKMAIENPQLLSKIQRAAAEMNKKSDIPSANNEQSGNDPSHVGSIIPSLNLQDKQTRKTEVAHFNGESSPQSAAQTHHTHHKKQNIAESSKSEKKDGDEEDSDRVTKDFVSPNTFAATDDITKAVSVAMHQLKRDKMYGEVYVRVHPGGKIRVMVQETRPQD